MRVDINSTFHTGKAAFVDYGSTAVLSFHGNKNVPLNTIFHIQGNEWAVTAVQMSSYVTGVVNVKLRRINDDSVINSGS